MNGNGSCWTRRISGNEVGEVKVKQRIWKKSLQVNGRNCRMIKRLTETNASAKLGYCLRRSKGQNLNMIFETGPNVTVPRGLEDFQIIPDGRYVLDVVSSGKIIDHCIECRIVFSDEGDRYEGIIGVPFGAIHRGEVICSWDGR